MKLAIGSDECARLTDSIVQAIQDRGYDTDLFGHLASDKKNWLLWLKR